MRGPVSEATSRPQGDEPTQEVGRFGRGSKGQRKLRGHTDQERRALRKNPILWEGAPRWERPFRISQVVNYSKTSGGLKNNKPIDTKHLKHYRISVWDNAE